MLKVAMLNKNQSHQAGTVPSLLSVMVTSLHLTVRSLPDSGET